MDYDLRQILSAREFGCLKHLYNHCSKEIEKWLQGFNNIKYILAGTLQALTYLHANGYVHRDVKGNDVGLYFATEMMTLPCILHSQQHNDQDEMQV